MTVGFQSADEARGNQFSRSMPLSADSECSAIDPPA